MKPRFFVIFSLLFGLIAAPGLMSGETTSEIKPDDAQAIHVIVQSQLNALAEDDAAGAFALATMSTRTRLGNPDNFLRLIKEEYKPIYRHRLALFSAPEIIDGNIIQVVRLTDGENHVWLAVYQMVKEAGGEWRVDGCQLLETTSISI